MYKIQLFDKNHKLVVEAAFIDMDAVWSFLKEHYKTDYHRLYITKYG